MPTSKYANFKTKWIATASMVTESVGGGSTPTPKAVGALTYTLTDSATGTTNTPVDFNIKGICYSPCPIGESNKNGPNIGDWFWDSFTVKNTPADGGKPVTTSIWNWSRYWDTNANDATYRADLDKIQALGANAIRVYCMLPNQLNAAGDGFNTLTQTHVDFLDACYKRGIYVLIGFPFPSTYFLSGSTNTPSGADWLANFTTLLTATGDHPAVMAYTMLNEKDGLNQSYVTSASTAAEQDDVTTYWNTLQSLAATAKTNAADKLIGQAFHDMPVQWTEVNAPYLNIAADVDFWGVNTYQSQTLAPVFEKILAIDSLGFDGLGGITATYPNVFKPVILTEIGWPATGHHTDGDIYYDTATGTKTAAVISDVCPQAYSQALCLGMFYFEYCDEWWSQPGDPVYEWNGGEASSGMPNGFTDLEGFGLYQTGKNSNIPDKTSNSGWPINWDASGNGPYPFTDPITDRTTITTALSAVYSSN